MSEHVRIGTGDDCDVKIRLPAAAGAPSDGSVIDVTRIDGTYRIAKIDPGIDVKLNGRPIKPNKGIHDGDEIWIGPAGPSIHFFPIAATTAMVPGRRGGAHVAPFIEQAAMEASATARRDDAKIFLREFTRELVREIKPSTKLVTLAIAVALVGGVLYLGFAMFKEIQRSRRLIDDQRSQLGQMRDQVLKTNTQLSDLGRSTKELQDSLSLAVKLRSEYGRGVCLIAGSYYFVES